MMARLKQAAEELSLPVQERTRIYNTRRATELGKWAEGQGCGEAFHDAIFRGYFAEGLNISDMAVLRETCSRLGLEPDEAERVLAEGEYASEVDEDWDYARKLGVTAVPTFRAAGRTVIGAQPYEVLERLVTVARERGPRVP
jgi:predicted DsbA family dithiol-disulfide isomerase